MAAPITFTREMRQQLVRALPDAMRPTWLEKTWSGAHGERGLTARVHTVSADVDLGADTIEGSSYVRGHVRDGDANVGRFTRDLTLHDSGRLEVHHSFLELDERAQGSGFARAFNDRAFARYAKAGVDDVTILAALDVGGYAWARQGFELEVHGATAGERALERARIVRNLVAEAEREGQLTTADAARLDPLLLGADGVMHRQTLASVQDLAAIPDLGRKVLLGNSWDGIREIQRERAWWHGSGSGTKDVRAGVSYLATPDLTLDRAASAARSVEAALPAPTRTANLGEVFARHFANSAHVEPARTHVELTTDKVGVAKRANIDLGDATIKADIETGRHGTLNVRQSIRGGDAADDALRTSLDAAWRDLGITAVAEAGTRRTL